MRPKAQQEIDGLKPYKDGNPPLWRIHELNRIDKHRTLLRIGADRLYRSDWLPSMFWLKENSPEFSAEFDTDEEQDVQLEIDEAVSKTQVSHGNAVLPTLHHLVDYVEGLIPIFKPFL